MQERIYRFVVNRSLQGGVYAANDTAADGTTANGRVMLYAWTPPIEERQRARAAVMGMAGRLGCEVFAAGASLYLVAAAAQKAREALAVLHGAGLFRGVEAEAEAVGTPVPPPPPPFVEVRTGHKDAGRGRPAAVPGRARRRPWGRLAAFLLGVCALAGLAVVGLSSREGATVKPPPLVGPTLTVEPGRARPGDQVNLQWSSSGYAQVQLDGRRIDSAGNRIVIATTTHLFRLRAVTADGESRMAEARLVVLPGHSRAGKPPAGSQ